MKNLGSKEGDWVYLGNMYGKAKEKAHLTPAINTPKWSLSPSTDGILKSRRKNPSTELIIQTL
ncbi:hypothetical protein LPY66_09855 [Dehalobacter sp. DCM]|uniref:hypothetical protein n=1 Tax=Dehalobacter sp. DCM TaxID=2907827 RepID=UPI0030815754|nr:hypothetical protein LPY66_09855 [Dehalobacter sp. DCM]